METKVCSCCGQEKDITSFKRDRFGRYSNVCRECATNKRLETLKRNKERFEAQTKQEVEEARKLRLQDFTPRELLLELKRRGYDGTFTYTETRSMTLSKLE